MGVDTKSICMFGKRFDSFKHCLDYLELSGQITSKQAAEDEEYGELGDFPLVYQSESCYSEQGGVLGLHVDNLDSFELSRIMQTVAAICPNSKLEHFTYWY